MASVLSIFLSKKKIRGFLLLLPICLIATGCFSGTEIWEPKIIDNKDILELENCDQLCWKGLIPGTTTYGESLKTIIEQTNLDNESKYELLPQYIKFYTSDENDVVIKFSQNKVLYISFDVNNIDLGSAVAYFGTPKGYYINWDGASTYHIDVVYPEEGLILTAGPGGEDFVSEKMPLLYVGIFDPTSFEQLELSEDNYIKWEGFGIDPFD